MKPKTKLQKAVVKSMETLPPLSDYQRQQAIEHVAEHIAKCDSKGNYVCLDCGHKWHGEKSKAVVCPECGAKLKVDTSRKWNFSSKDYFAIITRCNGLQVIRMFLMSTVLRRSEKAQYWIGEAFQRWITPDRVNVIVSRKRNFMAHYCDSWDWGSDLELRNEHYAHSIGPYKIIGKRSVIPELIRNGFDGNFHDANPHYLFNKLFENNKIETLWKVGQFALARHFIYDSHHLNECWPSIKILMRHHYHVKDATMWCDLWGFLHELGKDVRNPKFICPQNLKATHDDWQRQVEAKREREHERLEREHEEWERQRELDRQREYISDVERVKADQCKYEEAKSKFFDLEFTDDELIVKPLVSVTEFLNEGNFHHHCVFTAKYYEKPQSLIFHALIDGISVATIEFNLERMEIMQCRGKHNSKPEQYDRIIALINKNKNQIIKKHTA